jgi:hypothetical protein
MSAYPKPATPLPWDIENIGLGLLEEDQQNWDYFVHTANVFPHLVEALEGLLNGEPDNVTATMRAVRALTIARGEVTP